MNPLANGPAPPAPSAPSPSLPPDPANPEPAQTPVDPEKKHAPVKEPDKPEHPIQTG